MLAGGPFAGVVFNRPIEQVLTYRVPGRLERDDPARAARARAAGPRRQAGGRAIACGSTRRLRSDLDPARIKDVVEVLDPLPLIDDRMLELTRWMADYYACSWGQALDAVVPAGVKKHAGTRIGTFLMVPEEIRADLQAEILKRRLPPKQAAVLEVLCRSDEPLTVADVCRLAKCTTAPIQGLEKQGLVHTVRRRMPVGLPATRRRRPKHAGEPASSPDRTRPIDAAGRPILTAEQAADPRADWCRRSSPAASPRF